MRLPDFLSRIPQPLFFVPPIGAFLIMAGVGFGAGQIINDDSASAPAPVPTATTAPVVVAPDPTLEPTATVLPDRTDCDEIDGTDYRSAAERNYYLEDCTVSQSGNDGNEQAAAQQTQSGTGDSGASSPPPPPVQPIASAGGAQVPLAERLVISSIGVNADVYGTVVGADGAMADPFGYFNVVRYDFSNHAGLGGGPHSGNLVLAGHVDSAVYGAVVFYSLSSIQVGAIIEYYTADGGLVRYEVTGAGTYLPTDNWADIVASTTADITLITCTGSFNTSIAGEYSHRQAVFGKRL